MALATLAVAGETRADAVTLSFVGPAAGRVVHATVGSHSRDLFAGRSLYATAGSNGQLNGLPRSILTFCVDVFAGQTTSNSPFTSTSVAKLSGDSGRTTLGSGAQQAIYDLYQAANTRELTAGSEYATAFQLALWEVVYDYNPVLPNRGLDVTVGNFHATERGRGVLLGTTLETVRYLLGSVGVGAGPRGLIGLRNGDYPDQLYSPNLVVVPLPMAAWAGLSGLGLMVAVRRIARHV